ncbi:unnamed protein product [Prunus armeniaca]|uniref:Secreted protein n=1 Tax=Prunus armeniaca TaxID=36596 RepID=A0A6J5VWX5_PRUAR|nr:unnamed protein product [Prunus armeniaca]
MRLTGLKVIASLMGCAHLLLNHGGSAYMAWADIAVLHPRVMPCQPLQCGWGEYFFICDMTMKKEASSTPCASSK